MMTNSRLSHKGARHPGLYAFACLALVGTCLALSLVVAKLADGASAPRLTFLMVAMLSAGLLLIGLCALQRQPMPINRRTLEYTLVTGVLLALPNALGFLAVRHVGAGFISLSFAFPILITWLLAVLIGLEAMRGMRLLGVLLGLSGGLILAAAKAGDANIASGWAALILAMPVALAVGNIYRTLRWPTGAAPIFLAALMLLGAAASLLPFALTLEPGQFPVLVQTTEIAGLLLLEILVFSVLYVFYFVLQKLAGPVYLSQIGTVAAVVGTVLAVFALGEQPPPNLGIAGTIIVLAIVIFHRAAPPSAA